MEPEKVGRKPMLSSLNNKKPTDSLQQKMKKIELFYRYRLPSIYRELKKPVYEKLLKGAEDSKAGTSKIVNKTQPNQGSDKILSIQQSIQILYKKVMLNSKYHHREKMRFSRTPLLKYLQYQDDFQGLEEKLKSKTYNKIYDDLEDDDDSEQDKQDHKQYEPDPLFSEEALNKYKRKHNITGKIVSAQGYEDIKNRLITKYGWTENPDVKSLMYDYKHMSKKKHINYVNILESQVVNHFHENKSITAKFGLTRNIRNICSLAKDPNSFFPRCFDVNDLSELENFYESFKETYAQSILKRYLIAKGMAPADCNLQQFEKIIDLCLKINQRQLVPILQKVQEISKKKTLIIMSEEMNTLRQYDKIMSSKAQLIEENFNQKLFQHAKSLEEKKRKLDPQWQLNRDNIWIIKPASMSRGRGIKTFNDINQIFDYIIGKQISWVAQKYIENPLIIRKRKFDIRQWVLLTDFKPFRVWIYQQCYIRFCATEYTPENLKDRKIHLTNNSVTKGISDIVGDGIDENMLSEKQFVALLKQVQQGDVFYQKVRPLMQKIAVKALESVKQNMVPRRNTFQVFGFDFMVDQDYKVWLIEVNSSPTMQYSTKVTTDIVKKGMSDLGDLVNNYMFGGKNYNKDKARELYGGWKLLTNH